VSFIIQTVAKRNESSDSRTRFFAAIYAFAVITSIVPVAA